MNGITEDTLPYKWSAGRNSKSIRPEYRQWIAMSGIARFKYKHDRKTRESDMSTVIHAEEFIGQLRTGNLLKDSAAWSTEELHTGGNKHE